MKTLGLVIVCMALMNCGKKVETVPTPVVADAGVSESVVKADPDPKPVEVPVVSESK